MPQKYHRITQHPITLDYYIVNTFFVQHTKPLKHDPLTKHLSLCYFRFLNHGEGGAHVGWMEMQRRSTWYCVKIIK